LFFSPTAGTDDNLISLDFGKNLNHLIFKERDKNINKNYLIKKAVLKIKILRIWLKAS